MKSKKLSALIAIVLTLALLAPITATASNHILKAYPLSTVRATIAQNNADIIGLKQQAKTLVEKIRSDLAGTKGIDSITSSQDYKDIISKLQSLKGTLGRAEARDYISGLKGAKGKSDHNALAALDNVIAIQKQKEADLTTAIASLNDALANADAIAALKTSATNAWNDYKTQAIEKKKTIDQNHVKIVQAFADNKRIISTIIVTASANKDVLQTKPDDVAAIEAKLTEITNTLKGIHDDSIIATNKQFNADKKNKDSIAMLADLNKIISIQLVRITTLASTKSQLQDILNQLNSIIGSSSASV
jgi:hypothetical protein